MGDTPKEKMNVIVINTDTLRADHLGAYGHPWMETPNLDRFAARSIQYNNAFMESGPTVQMRRVWFTGQSLLPYEISLPPKGIFPALLGWKPLAETDTSIAETMQAAGHNTCLVTDLWHFFKPAMNLHRGFDSWIFERGHETDSRTTGPNNDNYDTKQHISEAMWTEHYDERTKAYLKASHPYEEEDYFCGRTFRRAAQAAIDLSESEDPFFMWIDTFVPHEPWDGRKKYWWNRYKDKLNVKSEIEEPIFFYGADMFKCTQEDNDLFHAVYCGMVTELDFWFGYLINMIESLGLFENTMIVFTSDHGTEFFDHGQFQKHPELLHREVCQLPLLVHHPAVGDKHVEVDALVSGIDFAPTILNAAGVAPEMEMDGEDFIPLATGEKAEIHEYVKSGYCHFASVRTQQWNMIFPVCTADDTKALEVIKSQPDVALDVIHAIDAPPADRDVELYDTVNDPTEQNNVAADHPDVVKELKAIARQTWPNAPKLQD